MKDGKQAKQSYETPRVTPLGDVKSLTQGPLSGTIDSIFGGPGGFTPGLS